MPFATTANILMYIFVIFAFGIFYVIHGSTYIILSNLISIKYVNYKYTRRRCVPSVVKRENIKMIDAIRKVMP